MASEELAARRELLDDALVAVEDRLDPTALLEALVRVLSRIDNVGLPDDEVPMVSAAAADAIVAEAELVKLTLEANPWLARAPDGPVVQQWMTSSGHATEVAAPREPNPERFIPVATLVDADLVRRPLPGGLFTSSALPGRPSMWELFVAMNSGPNEDANVWRRPW